MRRDVCQTSRNSTLNSRWKNSIYIHQKRRITMSAAAILSLINYGFVLIFGIIVSFYFAGICWEDNKRLYILTIIAFAIFQTVSYITFGKEILYKCYPIFIHIPLILIIRYICHQNIYISSIAVMSAYLMCTPRKWFGTLAMYSLRFI